MRGTGSPRLVHGRVVVALLVLALATLSGCEGAPSLSRIGPDEVVVAFGDSLTHGTGAGAAESYPAQLQRLIGRRVVAAGVPGETTAEGLRRLPAVLEVHAPTLVILCLGGNDFLRRHDETQTRANLRAMLELLTEQRVETVLVGVPRGALSGEAASLYAELAREFRIPLEKRVVGDVLHDPALKSDPIHPNGAGYARIAGAIAELLRGAGAL